MEPKYPLFILARDDKSLDMILNSKQLGGWYEQIDVEENLYEGWDSEGHTLKIFWDQNIGKANVEIIQEMQQVEKLRETIFTYAKLYRPKVPFVYSGPKDNVVGLFKAVDEHIKAGRESFTQKLGRLFKTKKFQKDS